MAHKHFAWLQHRVCGHQRLVMSWTQSQEPLSGNRLRTVLEIGPLVQCIKREVVAQVKAEGWYTLRHVVVDLQQLNRPSDAFCSWAGFAEGSILLLELQGVHGLALAGTDYTDRYQWSFRVKRQTFA